MNPTNEPLILDEASVRELERLVATDSQVPAESDLNADRNDCDCIDCD